MSQSVGVIGISEEGKYLVESKGLGHLGTRTEYYLVDDVNNATLFFVLPKQNTFKATSVPAWTERVIHIGVPDDSRNLST